jgi:predicted methyltransferase
MLTTSFACRTYRQDAIPTTPPRVATTGERSVVPGINDSYADPEVDEWVARFETESREIYVHRDRIVSECGVRPGMIVADVGAGTGLFTPLFAAATGPGGTVLAVDIVPEFLDLIRTRSRELGLVNVQTVLCAEDSLRLEPESVDVVFVCDTYHHFEFPRSTLKSMHSALRPGGRLVIVDFIRIPGQSRAWVLDHVRCGEETVRAEVLSAGFVLDDTQPDDSFLSENYIIAFKKPD